jgi:hypothetical protein
MALDQTKMGRVVADQMEAIEADYGDVCAIVEVMGPHGSHLRVRGSDMRPHIMVGLLRLSENVFIGGMRSEEAGGGELE